MMMPHQNNYARCRYGDEVAELFGGWEVVRDHSTNDYQGEVEVLFKLDDRYAYVQFYYGSCSGCDEWEYRDLDSEQVKEEIRKLTVFFDTPDQLDEYYKRTKDSFFERI